MSLRLAEIKDTEIVTELLLDFHRASPYRGLVADPSRVKNLVQQTIFADRSRNIVILWDNEFHQTVGMIIGQAAEFSITGDLIASELAWYVHPGFRKTSAGKELLEAYEFWATKIGCRFIQTVALNDRTLPVLKRHYERNGYEMFETCFLKEINNGSD